MADTVTLTLEQLRALWPSGIPVRRDTRYGVVDDVTIVCGHPAVYVTWLPTREDSTNRRELVTASQLTIVGITR